MTKNYIFIASAIMKSIGNTRTQFFFEAKLIAH